MNDMETARILLQQGEYTLVLCRDGDIRHTGRRGVGPLLDLLDSGEDFSGFSAADKAIGKGAAFLYVLLGIGRIHTALISEPALEVLESHGVTVSYDLKVDAILNRDKTGFCPVETSVRDISSPDEAEPVIRETYRILSGK